MNEYVASVLNEWAPSILGREGVAVPDNEEEMNWRLFFAHSQDLRGFRADIFTGGPNEDDNPRDPSFGGLRDRWPDSKTMIQGLAELWDDPAAQEALKRYSNPFRSAEDKRPGIRPVMDILRGRAGNEATHVFAQTLDDLRGDRIARKTNAMIRAYAQNADLLTRHGCSFRAYLLHIVPDFRVPAADVTDAEKRWIGALIRDFYNVGPALANYMLGDWLFGLWREGQVGWFRSYKADSVFLGSLPELPKAAVADFVGYSRTLQVQPEWVSNGHAHLSGRPVPPRVLNEAIWLDRNLSSQKA